MDLNSKETKLILSTIRRAWNRYPERYAALNRTKVSWGVYTCEECGEPKRKKLIQVDHIVPIIPVTGLDSIEGFITRLFCKSTGLRILCTLCHYRKSGQENVIRLKTRKARNVK